MRDLPLVYAVVLNWNKPKETFACVKALSQQQYASFKVIVIDNGSTNDELAWGSDLPMPFLLLRNEANLGFAGGVNVGITRALSEGADYVWLVNNDAVPEPDALSRLIMAVRSDARVGLASPMILNADAGDKIEFCGGLWANNTFQTTNDPCVYHQWREMSPGQIWLVGTALLLNRVTIEAVGLFNERLFAYWEDNDYSIRCIRAGFYNVVVLDSIVRHWSGKPQTDPELKPIHYHYYMARNEILFIRENVVFTKRFKLLVWAIVKQLRKMRHLRMPQEAINSISAGLWDGFRNRGGPFREEKHPPSIIAVFLRKVANLDCN